MRNKKTLNWLKKKFILAIPLVLIFNVAFGPFIGLVSANGGVAPVSAESSMTTMGTMVSAPDTVIGSAKNFGLFGLDTLWNGVKGFFNAMAELIRGFLEIVTCIQTWGQSGGILTALIACPAIMQLKMLTNFLVVIFEGMFNIRIFSDTSGLVVQSVTSQFTAIANIAFVIILLIVVFSMVTSIGLSNYHIKKMLPKILVVAVLVNVSYWVCALMVDVSNIGGAQLKGFIRQIRQDAVGDSRSFEDLADNISDPTVIYADLSSAGTVMMVMPIILLVVVIMMFIAAITVPILAVIRTILCMFLVILSPLAFVCLLHPKTQPLFTKWFKEFGNLLIIYPAFAVIVGMSEIAATVFYSMPISGAGGAGVVLLKTLGAIISIAAPVLFIKKLMTSSSKMMAAASKKVDATLKATAMVAVTAATMGAGAAAAGAGAGAKLMGGLKAGGGKFGQIGNAMEGMGKRGLAKGKKNWLTQGVANNDKKSSEDSFNLQRGMADAQGDQATVNALDLGKHNDSVKNYSAKMINSTPDQIRAATGSSNAAERQAAWTAMGERGMVSADASQFVGADAMQHMSIGEKQAAMFQNRAVAEAMQRDYGKLVGGSDMAAMTQGAYAGAGAQDALEKKFSENASKLSTETIVGDQDTVEGLNKIVKKETETITVQDDTNFKVVHKGSAAGDAAQVLQRVKQEVAANPTTLGQKISSGSIAELNSANKVTNMSTPEINGYKAINSAQDNVDNIINQNGPGQA